MCASPSRPRRERRNFDADWRFQRHDPDDHNDASAHLTYAKLQPWVSATGTDLIGAGTATLPARPTGEPSPRVNYVKPDFDDSGWRRLDLPHDWGIEGSFDQNLPGGTGKLPWSGVGWYRKAFHLDLDSVSDRQAELELDGAMSQPTVWLNGRCVGGWVYGYTTFRVDLTPYLAPDGHNVIAVRLNNPPDSSRWYPGSGLYRHVWLVLTPKLRFAPWGIHVTTPKVTDACAWIDIDLVVEQHDPSAASALAVLDTAVYELDERGHPLPEPVARSRSATLELDPTAARHGHRRHSLTVLNPKRWHVGTPHRYLAVTRLTVDDESVDEVKTAFGVRTFKFDADAGFLLNERVVPIRGVCQHHDLGALGTAVNERALERQLEILQEMGCNAIRTAHNPPTPELLDLCDRMGFLVMDEAFDSWRIGKRQNDYAQHFDEWHERDLRAMIRRDRNHPCVIVWSIGNEILEQDLSDGWKLAAHLAGIVREEDRSRPITVGCNREISGQTGYQSAVDVIGFNYKPWAYNALREIHPLVPTYGSETASCVSSRGEYVFPVSDDKFAGLADFQVSSYDLSAPPWAWAPDDEFNGLDDAPQSAGEFVWTGFDYLGEPTPYNADSSNLLNFSDTSAQTKLAAQMAAMERHVVPSRSSYFGIVDLAGLPKDRYFLYQARWRPELPMAHILPHWNWPTRIGQITPVHVYTSGDAAELFLNGQSLGHRTRGPRQYRLRWDDVVYEPGELRVIVTRQGQPWAEAMQRTTSPAAALAVEADRRELLADGRDLAYLTVRVIDAAGQTVPRSHPLLRFQVSGAADLVAVDNGDPTSHRSFQSPELPAFNGLAVVVVRTRREPGPIIVTITAAALSAATAQLCSLPPAP